MPVPLILISHKLCPYVQRAVIALTEKGVAFERIDIDLSNKPDWFLKISPLGKVPVLSVGSDAGEVALFESNVICEYIEETQGGAKLHPQDPLQRAQHRAWMEFGSTIPWRTVGPRDHRRSRNLRGQAHRDRRKICPRRSGAGLGAVFCRRKLQPDRRGVRADLPLFRRVRHADRSFGVCRHAEGTRVADGIGKTAERPRRGRRRLSAIAARLPGPS